MTRELPCVGCGWCCTLNPCSISRQVYPPEEREARRCPALIWEAGRYACRLMRIDQGVGMVVSVALLAGEGCALLKHDPWRNDVKNRDELMQQDEICTQTHRYCKDCTLTWSSPLGEAGDECPNCGALGCGRKPLTF